MRAVNGSFTLIELIIVVVIIGVVYASALSVVRYKDNRAQLWSLPTLDQAMRRTAAGYKKLVCGGERCERCELQTIDGEVIGGEITLFDEPPTIYAMDKSGYLDTAKYNDETCFVMEKYDNNALSNLLVEHKTQFYRYYPILRRAEVFADLESARRTVDHALNIPLLQNQLENE